DARGTPLRIDTLHGSLAGGSTEPDRLVGEGAGATPVASGAAETPRGRARGALRGTARPPAGHAAAPTVAAAAGAGPDPADGRELDTTFRFDEDAGDGRWQASVDWSRLAWRREDDESLVSPNGRLVVQPGANASLAVELDAALD